MQKLSVHSLRSKAQQGQLLGLYCHVPFCKTTCDFCAFYQEKPRGDAVDRYLKGVAGELRLLGLPSDSERGELLFWGGGTPGLLAPRDLERLGQTVLQSSSVPQEWTVEMAPSTVTEEKVQVLRDLGVTRISLGVQSFDSRHLEALGRQDSLRQTYRAYERVCSGGFDNINIDLIFGAPGQQLADWRKDLAAALALEPTHISTYCLTFEEDTALWLKLARGQVQRNVDQEASFYEMTWEVLQAAGFEQYEVSNFARPGYECLHNINIWRMGQWVGLGPSAASQFEGWRFTNPASLDDWLRGIKQGHLQRMEVHEVSHAILVADALIFGLRMNEGVDLGILEQRFGRLSNRRLLAALFEEWQDQGLAVIEGQKVRVSDKGRLIVDALAVAILQRFP